MIIRNVIIDTSFHQSTFVGLLAFLALSNMFL